MLLDIGVAGLMIEMDDEVPATMTVKVPATVRSSSRYHTSTIVDGLENDQAILKEVELIVVLPTRPIREADLGSSHDDEELGK